MKITFNSTKTVQIVAAVTKNLDEITIIQLVDQPERKTVYAETREIGRITLWQGTEYDAIGQWTDQDVMDKINELY